MQLHSGRDKRVEGLKQHIPPGSCGEVTGRVFLSTFMGLRCSPKKKKKGGTGQNTESLVIRGPAAKGEL